MKTINLHPCQLKIFNALLVYSNEIRILKEELQKNELGTGLIRFEDVQDVQVLKLKTKLAEDQATMDHLGISLQFILSSSNRGRLLGIIDLMIQKNLLKRIKNETKGSKSTIWNSTKDGGF
ncbi:hypothetical protein Tco_0947322 [Tanacetum coccineum]